MALLRLPEVIRLSGYSRSMLYALISQGLYPKPVKISERAVAWPSEEVEQMVQAIVAHSSKPQRKDLVVSIESRRLALLTSMEAVGVKS
jgi:prophage regulatory protein